MLLPAWLAATLQLPTASSVRVVPLAVQTPDVVDANATASPDVDVAASGAGTTPKVWLPGEVKVMVCAVSGAAETVKLLETAGAGA